MEEGRKIPVTAEAFRDKKAAPSYKAPGRDSGLPGKNNGSSRQSTENHRAREVGIDQRQEKVRLLREKQVEERKKKNEGRRVAFEERKRQKELEDKAKWEAMKELALKQGSSSPKSGTGRKLPSIPTDRPSTAGMTRPSSIPRLSRPSTASAGPSKNASRVGDSPADTSPVSTPSNVWSSLGGAKSVSASNLSAAPRRASSGNVGPRPRSSSKPRQGTTGASKHASSQNSLAPGKSLSKAQSTSSIHNIGNSRKSLSLQKKEKQESKPKAGMMDEAAAKQALAERRRKAREETERLAMLDKQRQEEERVKREEEARIRAEEEAKEEARMRELAELLRQQEEERLKQAVVEKEKRDEEEAERLAAEAKQREVERLAREEDEKRAREEAERKAIADEERRKQEEIERQERKRRVEQIMSRTRQTAHTIASDDVKPTLQVLPNNSKETKILDMGDTKRKVNEILQKVKGLSGSQSNLAQIDQDDESGQDCSRGSSNMVMVEPDSQDHCSSAVSDRDSESNIAMSPDCESSEELTQQGSACNSENGLSLNGKHSDCVDSSNIDMNTDVSDIIHVRNGNSLGQDLLGNPGNDSPKTLTGRVSETQRQNDSVGYPKVSGSTENTANKSSAGMDNDGVTVVSDSIDGGVSVDHMDPLLHNGTFHGEDEDLLWVKAEKTMKAREAHVVEALENSGVVAEGDEDEESEEEKMWKVIEGKLEIGEAV